MATKYKTETVDVEIDLSDFEDHELMDEVIYRGLTKPLEKPPYISVSGVVMTIEKMKYDYFIKNFDTIDLSDLEDIIRKKQ